MDAIGIERGREGTRLLEIPRPDPGAGVASVRTLRVGTARTVEMGTLLGWVG